MCIRDSPIRYYDEYPNIQSSPSSPEETFIKDDRRIDPSYRPHPQFRGPRANSPMRLRSHVRRVSPPPPANPESPSFHSVDPRTISWTPNPNVRSRSVSDIFRQFPFCLLYTS